MATATESRRGVFQTISAGIARESARNSLIEAFDALAAQLEDPAVTDKAPIEAQLAQLERDAAVMARGCDDWSPLFYLFLGFVVLLCFGSLWAYFGAIGASQYTRIEATRPILVFTLIIAMLGFGGTLIFRSLFSTESTESFQQRFRLAREIFLVYSGIFGTIIGFYFGAASGEAAANPPSLAVPALRDGLMTVQVNGGTSPFTGVIRLRGDNQEDQPLAVSGNTLTIQLDQAHDCPAGAQIRAEDSDSRIARRTIDQTAVDLRSSGWTGCTEEAAAEQANDAATNIGGDANAASGATTPPVPKQ